MSWPSVSCTGVSVRERQNVALKRKQKQDSNFSRKVLLNACFESISVPNKTVKDMRRSNENQQKWSKILFRILWNDFHLPIVDKFVKFVYFTLKVHDLIMLSPQMHKLFKHWRKIRVFLCMHVFSSTIMGGTERFNCHMISPQIDA